MSWREIKDKLQAVEADDVLERIGLEIRRSTSEKMLPGLVLFGAGLIVGAGLVALLTPRSGPELRSSLKNRLGRDNCCEHSDLEMAQHSNG
ncbi:MAG: YtxH domain-containing protein [Cystobacterineae bacterium]|nr:YtxH domain-containing protein [Cystobacterineae bacterium]